MAGNQASLLMAIIVIAGISGMCSAVTHIVGGSTGWTVPPSPAFYSNWASGQTFQVDDVLVFNFPTNAHTVAEVNQANYNSCNVRSPIGSVHTTGPTSITLTTAGTHYYICTVGTHCTNGQRLTVTVTGPTAASPASSPSPAGGAATPASSPATPSGGAATPTGGPTVPAASSPTGAASGPTGSTPSDNFAASTGVSVLSLVSVAVAALMY